MQLSDVNKASTIKTKAKAKDIASRPSPQTPKAKAKTERIKLIMQT